VHGGDGAYVLAKTMSFYPLCYVHIGEAIGV